MPSRGFRRDLLRSLVFFYICRSSDGDGSASAPLLFGRAPSQRLVPVPGSVDDAFDDVLDDAFDDVLDDDVLDDDGVSLDAGLGHAVAAPDRLRQVLPRRPRDRLSVRPALQRGDAALRLALQRRLSAPGAGRRRLPLTAAAAAASRRPPWSWSW